MSEKILKFDSIFFAYEMKKDLKDVQYTQTVVKSTDVAVYFHIFCEESKFAWEVFFPYTGDIKYRRFKTNCEKYFIRRSRTILKNMGLTDNSISVALKLSRLYWRDLDEKMS